MFLCPTFVLRLRTSADSVPGTYYIDFRLISSKASNSNVTMFLMQLLFWILPFGCTADQIVYLDRNSIVETAHSNIPMAEPAFNPKSLSASVGETVHFVARFADQTSFGSYGVLLPPEAADT